MRTKLGFLAGLAVLASVVFCSGARADWTAISGGLPAADVHWVGLDSRNPDVLYAASQRQLYKSSDNGVSWNQIFIAWGFTSQIQSVYLDPAIPGTLYVSSGNAVWKSRNSGKNWALFYRGVGGETKNVFCVTGHPGKNDQLWLGTAEGVVIVDTNSGQARKISTFPNIAAYSILINPLKSGQILVSAAYGIYQSADDGAHWERALAYTEKEKDSDEDSLQGLGAEETLLSTTAANLIQQPALDRFAVPTPRGIYEASGGDLQWKPMDGKVFAYGRINYIAASNRYFYLATDRGVYRRDPVSFNFQNLSKGLPSEEVRMILYDAKTDRLLAATKKGIFQFLRPDTDGQKIIPPAANPAGPRELGPAVISVTTEEVFKTFQSEPTIAEIQRAAIEYAEVHPRKIQEWRRAAARKAWFPKVAVYRRISRDQNVDVDRGGTADPDKFIKGPLEDTGYVTVDMSWDLGEVIWNENQTSIDSRSKLMADLRDDVLNEVTHLYYERRRLQVEMVLKPAPRTSIQIEKRLHLEELTANIDGMTGGYLSNRLKNLPKPT